MIWEWVLDMAGKSTDRVREWSQENRERRRNMTREAMVRYREKHKNDPEYIERERETSRRTSATYRKKMKEQMTPEQLEDERRKNRERAARYRERQKAKKAEATAKEAGNEKAET